MAVIVKDLGIASAYGYAKSKGYTGTEEEFAELMANYADVAQQAEAAAQDAEDAKDEAVTANTDAQTAKTAAQAAQSAAETASGTASTKASEAAQSAQTAAWSATAAGNSATAAAGSAQTAQAAAQTATNKASEASSSASAASTAKTGAETARTGAQTAQTAAETAQANAEAAASSVSASAAQIEQNTEDIAGLKNDLNQFPNGTYPNMSVGNADQLTATVGIEDTAPYLYRTSGGSVDIGDRETVNKIVGGTIVNNQLVQNGNFADGINKFNAYGGTISAANGICNFTFTSPIANLGARIDTDTNSAPISRISGHKYLSFISVKSPKIVTGCRLYPTGDKYIGTLAINEANKWLTFSYISDETTDLANGKTQFFFGNCATAGFEVGDVIQVKNIMTIDLTQMLGTSIADYVYSLEQATAGAGVAWLKKHFPKQFDAGYQAYDAGSLQSVSGLTEHRMVGFNQWDGVAEVGSLDANGQEEVYPSRSRSKNYIPVLPNTTYYYNKIASIYYYNADKDFISRIAGFQPANTFTTPSDCYYLRFMYNASSVPTDFCINLSDPTKNGTYEPYEAHSYALDSDVVLRGIPKLDTNNQLYYDGDEYLPDGTVNRRYGIVDLGTLEWAVTSTNHFRASLQALNMAQPSATSMPNVITPKYAAKAYNTEGDKVISVGRVGINYVYINDSTYTDASALKTSLSGVYLVYELATPTTETADPYQSTQIVDDFGTEEFVLADGAFPVPVGHNTMYQNNLRAKLEMSPDSPDGDGLYVVQQESGENTYVPLSSTATIQDILTRLTALENA